MFEDGESQASDFQVSEFQTGGLRPGGGLPRWAVAVLVGVPLLVGIIFLIVSFALRSSAALSSYVQDHGVRRTAVIQSVNNIEHTSTHSVGTGASKHQETTTSYTAEVLVRLAAPVGGRTQTTVHVPDYENAGQGETLTVLVNPKDPGYAELPGAPSTSPILPMIFLIVGSVLLVIAVVAGVLAVRALRRGSPMAVSRSWRWSRG